VQYLNIFKKLMNSLSHRLSPYGKNILRFQLKIFRNTDGHPENPQDVEGSQRLRGSPRRPWWEQGNGRAELCRALDLVKVV
jgi:hypothetical protein